MTEAASTTARYTTTRFASICTYPGTDKFGFDHDPIDEYTAWSLVPSKHIFSLWVLTSHGLAFILGVLR